MDNLFEEDEARSSEEEHELADLPPAESRDAVYRLFLHLRRCGTAKKPPTDIIDPLIERLTTNPLRLLRLDDMLEVDELLWNFTVVQLQQESYSGSLLDDIEAWQFYREQASLASSANKPIQEIHLYNTTRDIPTIVYCQNKKRFLREFTESAVLYVSEIRYQLVFEKTKAAHIDAIPVDSASRVSKEEQVLIGVIGLDKKGDICIQGALSEIRLIVTEETVINSGIYCDSNTVIVRCVMEPYKEAMRCIEISHPPPLVEIDIPDFFGGKLTKDDNKALEEKFKQREGKGSEQWIVISDIHLDNDAVIESLETLLNTFIAMYPYQGFPTGFILMGNFMSNALNTARHGRDKYAQGFERLHRVLVNPKFRILLMSCYFVLIPGPGDATLCNQLIPTQPLLGDLTANLTDRVATHLGSSSKFLSRTNPCRIRHFTKRMVFCRSDLLNKLLSTSILTSGAGNKITSPSELKDMLISTVLGQGHLCPNKPGTHTVMKHDAALLLYPVPDLICIGDTSCPSFIVDFGATTICNIESFSKSRSFISYDIISGKCQKLAL